MKIHPTAVVDPSARLAADVEVGPYAYIGPEVEIGEGTRLMHHASIHGFTKVGRGGVIWNFAALGGDPQDLKYGGEKTWLEIGDDVVIREFATVNRGTPGGGGVTRVGNGVLIMAYAHVAHDCRIGNGVVMANAVNLAGHVIIEDRAGIGGMVAVHQFVHIGTHVFVGGASGVSQDLPPYTLAEGNRAKTFGLNQVGLRRAGFSRETIDALKIAYRIMMRSELKKAEALAKARAEVPDLPEVRHFLDFIEHSERGVAR